MIIHFKFLILPSLTADQWTNAIILKISWVPFHRKQGRATIYPRTLLDLIGVITLDLIMIFLPAFAIFGWGKPAEFFLEN